MQIEFVPALISDSCLDLRLNIELPFACFLENNWLNRRKYFSHFLFSKILQIFSFFFYEAKIIFRLLITLVSSSLHYFDASKSYYLTTALMQTDLTLPITFRARNAITYLRYKIFTTAWLIVCFHEQLSMLGDCCQTWMQLFLFLTGLVICALGKWKLSQLRLYRCNFSY